jgi:DNA repair protein RadC
MKDVKKYELKKNPTDFPRVQITCSYDAAEFIKRFYCDDIGIFESFFVLMLDRSNHTIGFAKISQGGVSGTVVDTRIVAKFAIDSLASGIILAHNHPSGTLKPSDADEKITDKIKSGLAYFDIEVLDHIIVTEDGYTSFSDTGRI